MAEKRKFNEEEGCDGRIVRVKLKNFLTYDDVEFEPGDHLNVILGPNGTGKSSIVCAICLGLGGLPSLLGRAKDVGDYVKHRTKQTIIEIELYRSNGPNLIVKRVINKGKNGENSRSLWYMNGKESSGRAVIDEAKKMNVQMNNLCQFLPQDKVVEFAKMSPQQLLEATEKAVGPPGMFEDHMRLAELRSKYGDIESCKKEKEIAKERIEQRNKTLERDVQRYKEREKYQEKIEMLEKKKPWVEYEDARQKFMEIKKDKGSLEKRIVEDRKLNAPMEKEVVKCKVALRESDEKIKQLMDKGNKTVRSMKALSDKMEKQQDKIDGVKQELASFMNEEASRQQKILRLQREITSLQKDFENAPNPEELKPRYDELSKSIRDNQIAMNDLLKEGQGHQAECNQSKAQIQALKSCLQELESSENQRLEILRRVNKHAYDAVGWLRENRSKFSGTVFEPIMTQINMKDIKDSVYLESIISFNDMKAFVCQNREDQNLFANETRENLKIDVAAVCPPSDSKDEYFPLNNLDSIRKYGFKNYLTDLFDAPKTVMQYLCENYHLYNIPVGNNYTERNSNQVIEGTQGMPRFCSSESIYTVRKSKYSNSKSISVAAIKKDGNLLNTSVDMEQKKRLDSELDELHKHHNLHSKKYQLIRKEHDAALKEQEVLKNERKDLMAEMKRRQTLSSQIETKQKRLADEEKHSPSIVSEETKSVMKIRHINSIRVGLVKDYKELIQNCVDIGKKRITMVLKQVQERVHSEQLESKFRESSESLKALEETFELVNQRSVQMKTTAKRLLKVAQDKTGGASDGELVPEYLKEAFDMLPNTLADIEALIHEEQAKLNCQYETNPTVVRDYQRNKKEIQSFDQQIEEQTIELDETRQEIDQLLEQWLLPLEALIMRINEQYCNFFRRMGCAGQISLNKDPNDDYKKFGIQIQVKFRAEDKLKSLTSTFQSGGERSVSTMLYLISLQELTKCPFRLVDEINQGMDPNNERRVFELVVETVCRPNTSQYFLITPKLLPDLKYNDQMTILTVFNGHWILPHNQFKVSDFIARKKRLPKKHETTKLKWCTQARPAKV